MFPFDFRGNPGETRRSAWLRHAALLGRGGNVAAQYCHATRFAHSAADRMQNEQIQCPAADFSLSVIRSAHSAGVRGQNEQIQCASDPVRAATHRICSFCATVSRRMSRLTVDPSRRGHRDSHLDAGPRPVRTPRDQTPGRMHKSAPERPAHPAHPAHPNHPEEGRRCARLQGAPREGVFQYADRGADRGATPKTRHQRPSSATSCSRLPKYSEITLGSSSRSRPRPE